MIVENCTNVVELTRVHYFDVNESGKNVIQVSTIYTPPPPPSHQKRKKNDAVMIKKNVFGHKWVLKINETNNDRLKKSKTKHIVYLVVFACIVIAVCFGIFLTIETSFFKKKETERIKVPNTSSLPISTASLDDRDVIESTTKTTPPQDEGRENLTTPVSTTPCRKCVPKEEICLTTPTDSTPRCRKIADRNDPTGCGGLCRINKEYCKLLDPTEPLYQCRPLRNTLDCSNNSHSCGNMCIPFKFRCDGIFHCIDKSDEVDCPCDLTTHFRCSNGTGCLEMWRKCDGKVDCWDNSDEIDCTKHGCGSGEVPCRRDGSCIKSENFCDGIYQCPDRSDEPKGCEVL